MVIIKKSTNNKCWRGCGKKGILPHCWWECKLVQLLWRTLWRSLKKLKIALPHDPAIPVLSTYLEKNIVWKKNPCIPVFNAVLFTTAKRWKQTEHLLTDEWIKKMRYLYSREYYSAIKKNEIMPFIATQMDLEFIIWSKVSQKNKYHMILAYVWIYVNDTNEFICKIEIDS